MSKQTNGSPNPANTQSVSSLYNLVSTLTKAQKRDFKKYTRFWGGKESTKYLRLFDIVNQYVHAGKSKQEILQHILTYEGFSSKSAVGSLASYLCGRILESVRNAPEISPRTNRLHTMMQDIKFLYNKGLHEECYDVIQTAMQLARDIDKAAYQLELLIWERRVLLLVRGVEQMAARVKEMVAEEQKIVQDIQTFFALNTLNNDLFLSLKQGLPLSEAAQLKMQEFLHHDERAYVQNLSLRARYWYFNSLYYYHEILHKQQGENGGENGESPHLAKALLYLDGIIELAENEGKSLVPEEPAFYNAVIDNYLNLCIRLGEFERVRHIEETLASDQNEVQLLRSVAFYRLAQLVSSNKFEAAVSYIVDNQLGQRLMENEGSIGASRLLAIRYTCGQAYFLAEDYNKASDWFAQIVNAPGSKSNINALLVSEFHWIISLYELKTFEQNPLRLLNNFLERLRHNHKSNDFLELVFIALKCAFGKKDPALGTHIAALSEKIGNNATLKTNFGLVMAWLEARYKGTSVAEEIIKYNLK